MLPRFGRSLARLRTHFRGKVRRDAKRVIRANMKQTRKSYNHKVSYKWIQWANLQPVLDCLMQAWIWQASYLARLYECILPWDRNCTWGQKISPWLNHSFIYILFCHFPISLDFPWMARGLFWRDHLGQARLAPHCLGWVGWQNSECGWFSPVFCFCFLFSKTTQKFSRDLERISRDLERIAEIWRDPIFHVFPSQKFMNPQ